MVMRALLLTFSASPISKSISTFPIYELGGLSPESYVDLIYYILDISGLVHQFLNLIGPIEP